MALIIIDFDLTISSKHIHNLLANSKMSTSDTQWGVIQDVEPIQFSDENMIITWQALFQEMHAAGHRIAIASFSSYGDMIKKYLKEKLQLSEQLLSTILIEAWFPENAQTGNKNKHIAKIIENIKQTYHEDYSINAEIVLIDDSENNLINAKKMGYSVVSAESNGIHLRTVKELLLPQLQPNTEAYINFIEAQKQFPNPLDFGLNNMPNFNKSSEVAITLEEGTTEEIVLEEGTTEELTPKEISSIAQSNYYSFSPVLLFGQVTTTTTAHDENHDDVVRANINPLFS